LSCLHFTNSVTKRVIGVSVKNSPLGRCCPSQGLACPWVCPLSCASPPTVSSAPVSMPEIFRPAVSFGEGPPLIFLKIVPQTAMLGLVWSVRAPNWLLPPPFYHHLWLRPPPPSSEQRGKNNLLQADLTGLIIGAHKYYQHCYGCTRLRRPLFSFTTLPCKGL
jgi:hypothetical protein